MQKRMYTLGLLPFLMASCTLSRPIIPSNSKELSTLQIDANMKLKEVKSDFELMKDWTPEERQYFIHHFVFKGVEIRNDTLVFVR